MYHGAVLQPRICVATHAVWALPRSLATTGGIIRLFSLPAGTKMFQFPAFASVSRIQIITLQVIGLSHSDIPGSQIICIYTGLFAAYHVLHRLREPRHPPCALTYFRQTVTNQHCQLSIVNRQFITSSYLQLLISFLYLQSCLCQYVKELSSVSNYR